VNESISVNLKLLDELDKCLEESNLTVLTQDFSSQTNKDIPIKNDTHGHSDYLPETQGEGQASFFFWQG
jgi:hypothetical protein